MAVLLHDPSAPARTQAAPSVQARDLRLDVLRGLALVFITITHTGGNWLVEVLPSHFGFSSGTEMFVLCSGIASGLAFGGAFAKRGFGLGTLRVLHRIWQIYWVHIAAFVGIAALTMMVATLSGRPALVEAMRQDVLLTHPREAILGLVTLTYLPPLFDILPLYIVLLAMIPVMMAARRLAPWLPFALAGGLYVVLWTGGVPQWRADPLDPARHWLFNPFGWQLLFFTGFFMARGWVRVPAPNTPWAVVASGLVLLAAVPLSWHVLTDNFGLFSYLRDMLLPASERSQFHILRFVHAMAAAYLVLCLFSAHPGLAQSGPARVLALMGRQTLAVFIASLPVAIVGGALIERYGQGLAPVLFVTAGGTAVLLTVAAVADVIKGKPWSGKPLPRPASAETGPAPAMQAGARLSA